MAENGSPHINDAAGWQWLTVHEVASRIGLTQERVRQLIRQKKIRATKIGGWLIRPQDLDGFIRSRTNVNDDHVTR